MEASQNYRAQKKQKKIFQPVLNIDAEITELPQVAEAAPRNPPSAITTECSSCAGSYLRSENAIRIQRVRVLL